MAREARAIMNVRAWYEGLTLRGTFLQGEPMGRHCSWRAGGPAERYFEPADLDDLATYLAHAPADEPITWLGLGSNVLVRDGGLPGTVIATARAFDALDRISALEFEIGAGVTCAKVAKAAAKAGLHGGEFFAGIPGSLGGALAMNAGAFGGETWRLVSEVATIDRAGVQHRRAAAEYRIAYRSVTGPAAEEWFTGARLRFEAGADGAAQERIRTLLAQRAATQPLGLPSCGSVFKNPPGDFAGRLIEAAGMKGVRCGGCGVSAKHANFIVNDANGTATDIETLIERVRAAVFAQSGIRLETEARILGRPPAGGPREEKP